VSTLVAAVAVYAARYALGRQTGATDDVCSFIQEYRDIIMRDAGCRQAIIRDIHDALERNPDLYHGDRWLATALMLEGGRGE
jgi:hypothetical protein